MKNSASCHDPMEVPEESQSKSVSNGKTVKTELDVYFKGRTLRIMGLITLGRSAIKQSQREFWDLDWLRRGR